MNPTENHSLLVTRLESLIGPVIFSSQINLKLERIIELLRLIGNPHKSYKTIHVGGTSGKGSTSTLIHNILQDHGEKVGLFTSPYLQVVNEMFLINGKMASTSEINSILDVIEEQFSAVEILGFGRPSYFEVKFAIAAVLFSRHNVSVAIIEVGLGGTLDATNVIEPVVSVLVSVGLDHVEILGDTVEKIASDKVGIIKKNSKVVCGFIQETTRHIALEKAKSLGVEIKLINVDFGFRLAEGLPEKFIFWNNETTQDILYNLSPSFPHNCACAIAAYFCYTKALGIESDLNAIRSGAHRFTMQARFERVQSSPTVMLDGAHNCDKIHSFFSALQATYPFAEFIIIVACKAGRDADMNFFSELCHFPSKKIVCTTFTPRGIWRPMDPLLISQTIHKINPNIPLTIEENSIAAVEKEIVACEKNDVICVIGSFFLAGDVRSIWHPVSSILPQSGDIQ